MNASVCSRKHAQSTPRCIAMVYPYVVVSHVGCGTVNMACRRPTQLPLPLSLSPWSSLWCSAAPTPGRCGG